MENDQPNTDPWRPESVPPQPSLSDRFKRDDQNRRALIVAIIAFVAACLVMAGLMILAFINVGVWLAWIIAVIAGPICGLVGYFTQNIMRKGHHQK